MKLVVALCLATATAHADSLQVTSRTRTVEIKDEAWGIVAFRMQIPEDWKFEGALLRDPYCGGAVSLAYRLTSPDGIAGYQTLPTFGWHWSDDPNYLKAFRQLHCKVMEPMSPADFLTYVTPSIRPDPTTIGKIEPTVDAAQLDAMIADYNQAAVKQRLQSKASGGGVHAVLGYTFHGQEVEENLRVVVQTWDQQTGAHHNFNAIADVSGLRAPKGQLPALIAALGPLVQKAAMTPEWQQRFQKKLAADLDRAVAQTKQRIAETGAMLKRNHEAAMKQSKERFDRTQKMARDREDARHRAAQAWTLYAGDEQLVKNPQTGQVTRVTTRGGTHGHQDATSGDIIMTDDPSFDPNYYLRGSWTQLENVDP